MKAENFFHGVVEQQPNGCWIRNKLSGYMSVRYRGKTVGGHRAAWMIANNQPIPPGMHVLHSCDNPPCINPSHLRLGTAADNMADKSKRGRSAISLETRAKISAANKGQFFTEEHRQKLRAAKLGNRNRSRRSK